jgi:tyrosine-specific transport protein
MIKINETFSAGLLIAGTAVGVGILGLPVQVGLAGFFPACIGLLIGIVLMYITGMVFAETYSKIENHNADIPTLVKGSLGKSGKYLVTIGYIIVFWGLLTAYFSAGTSILMNILPPSIPRWLVLILFFLPVTILLFAKFKYVLRVNAVIMIFLISSFIGLLIFCAQDIHFQYYKNLKWSYFSGIMPIILCTLAYQNALPVICQRFNGDIKKIRTAIIIGLGLIFCICILWLLAVIGCLPLIGHNSITSAMNANQPATIPLSIILQSDWITLNSLLFSIAAILTSYISICIGLLRFSYDLFAVKNNDYRKVSAIAFTFFPSVIISVVYPKIFLKMLDIVGGVGIVTLFGIIPSLMLIKQRKSKKQFFIGIIILSLFLVIFGLEVVRELGMLDISQDIANWKNF